MIDKDLIKKQVFDVLKYSQDFVNDDPKVDYLIDTWYENKKSFINFLKGELTYELPQEISFEMSETAKIKTVEDFVTNVEYDFKDCANLSNILAFFEDNKNNFYSNIVKSIFVFHDFESGREITIPSGMKINKALKFFISDKERLTDLQMAVSRIIQKDKVKGKLCVSVHPLDFLSLSENTHNWRSCHALDGEYWAGNLSYIVDKSTIVCYLKSETDCKLPNFPPTLPWNNKKWRALIHFSNDFSMMFLNKQYPFFSESVLDIIRSQLLPSAGLGSFWSKWDNTFITSFKGNNETLNFCDPYLPVGNYSPILRSMSDLICTDNGLNFCDLFSHSYTPYYSRHLSKFDGSDPRETKFFIGEKVKCLHCEEDYISVPDVPRCITCEEAYGTRTTNDFYQCAMCGERTYYRNLTYVDGFGEVCPSCLEAYEDDFAYCYHCGTLIMKNRSLKDEEGHYYCSDWCMAREGY